MKILFTFCCMLPATALLAQQFVPVPDFDQFVKNSGHAYVSKILGQNSYTLKPQRPTTLQQRVIAQSVATGGSMFDSTVFRYNSVHRGSAYRFPAMREFELYSFHISVGNEVIPYAYQSGNSYDVLADTFIDYSSTGKTDENVAYYNASLTYDSFYNAHYWEGEETKFRCRIRYNAAGQTDSVMDDFKAESDSEYSPYQLIVYAYDDDLIIGDTTYSGTSSDFIRGAGYHYNAGGKPDTITVYYDYGSIEVATFIAFSYTGDGKVQTAYTYRMNEGTYALQHKDSFGYTTAIDYPTYYEGIDNITTDPEGYKYRFYIGDAGMPDSLVIEKFSDGAPWAFSRSARYTYNDYGNPDHIIERWAGTTDERYSSFYYEEYDDGLGISTPGRLTTVLYPNPCTGYVHLVCEEQGTFEAHFTDIAGRLVKRCFVKGTGHVNKVDISGLAPGVYMLGIAGNGKAGFNKLVIR